MTHHDVVLYGGLALMALSALVLLMIILSMVAGLCYRLFMVTSGQAVIRRRGRRRREREVIMAHHRQPERVPLTVLMDGNAHDTTQPLERVDG